MQKVTGLYLCLPVAGSRPPFFPAIFSHPPYLIFMSSTLWWPIHAHVKDKWTIFLSVYAISPLDFDVWARCRDEGEIVGVSYGYV